MYLNIGGKEVTFKQRAEGAAGILKATGKGREEESVFQALGIAYAKALRCSEVQPN